MDPAAAMQSGTTLLAHVMSMHTQMHAMQRARPPLRADRDFGGDNKGVGTRLSAHYSNASGRSNWVSIAICLPGTTISSR